MSLVERIWRLIRANINSIVAEAEDPEKILEETVYEMKENLINLRQAVAMAIANQKRTERQLSKSEAAAEQWQSRAQLALEKGEENLARVALERRQIYNKNAAILETQIKEQKSAIDKLKEDMRLLEDKINEIKIKKDMYIARARGAEAANKIRELTSNFNSQGSLRAFERMEEKIIELEAQSAAMGEIGIDSLESEFIKLEKQNNIKPSLPKLQKKPEQEQKYTTESELDSELEKAAINVEIEKLRSELDNI